MTQFSEEQGDNAFKLSANFEFPETVGDDETPKEAVEEWVDSLSDEELGAYIRNNAVLESW